MKKKIIKAPILSLNTKVEQFAKFLRSKVKESSLKNTRVSKGAPNLSSANTVQQIAKKIRDEIHRVKNKKDAA
jgi:nitrogenase subunit NifH